MAQSLTWDGIACPYRQPDEPDELYTAMAARIRQTDSYPHLKWLVKGMA